MENFIKITIGEFKQFVGNTIFTATVIRKDGEEATINGRVEVAKGVKGTTPEATAKRNATLEANNMVVVFDMRKDDYRTLNLNALKELKAKGQTLKA